MDMTRLEMIVRRLYSLRQEAEELAIELESMARGLLALQKVISPVEPDRWRSGARVRHPSYGDGVVTGVEGFGVTRNVHVTFPGYGYPKTFRIGRAKLEFID